MSEETAETQTQRLLTRIFKMLEIWTILNNFIDYKKKLDISNCLIDNSFCWYQNF